MNSLQYKNKRKEKFAEIQKYALKKNGFILSDSDLVLYTKFFSEEKYEINTEIEIKDLLRILKELSYQADGKMNAKEIKFMYRRMFGLLLESSYIWNYTHEL